MTKVKVLLAKNGWAPLATVASNFVIDAAIQRKMPGKGAIATSRVCVVRAGKGI